MAAGADRRLQMALEAFAAEDLPEVLEEARREARERVRSRLADALTETMLARLRAPAGAPDAAAAPPATAERTQRAAPSHAEPAAPGGSAVYVYCVVPADTELPADLPSIDPANAPTLIRHGRLAAVVSDVPLADFGEDRLRERLADMDWLERTARAHEVTLETVGRHATLIPMRLCSMYRNQSGVTEMLAREAEALEAALEHLDGKDEWGVKAFAIEPPAPSASEPADSGTDYMRRRRGDRERRLEADQQRYDAVGEIHERLAATVADALTSPPQRPEVSGHPGQMLLNGVYLVEDGQRTQFLTLAEALRNEYREAGIEIEVTGPWPAYNFVPGTIGAAW